MKYAEFLERTELSKQEILAYSHGNLVSDPPPGGCGVLPAPPILMLDRITKIARDGRRGMIVGERDITLDDWFFQCHFRADPVKPGCLGVDAVWQLGGIYASLRGARGYGRALGIGEVEFFGQIRPYNKVVRYELNIRRYTELPASGAAITLGDATVLVDDEPVYRMKNAKVGIFTEIQYSDYPHKSERSIGGQMNREV